MQTTSNYFPEKGKLFKINPKAKTTQHLKKPQTKFKISESSNKDKNHGKSSQINANTINFGQQQLIHSIQKTNSERKMKNYQNCITLTSKNVLIRINIFTAYALDD